MRIRKITGFAAAAMLAAATVSGVPLLAHAAPASDIASESVRYDDLNLSSEAGVAALYRRIQNAARDVCGPPNVPGRHSVSQDWKYCVSSSVRQAILAIDKPQVTTYYADHLRVPVGRAAG
jgi:UrcA family protein